MAGLAFALRASSTLSAVGIDVTQVANMDILKSCSGQNEEEEAEEEAEEQEDAIEAPIDQPAKYQLRMCIHSGVQLPSERSYVVVEIGSENGEVKRLSSADLDGGPTQESQNPVWEFSIDEEIEVGNHEPNIEIQIHGKRIFQDRLLGGVKVPFRKDNKTWSTSGIKRQNLNLKSAVAPSFLSQTPELKPRILVCWQLASHGEPLPDLNRIAEMSPDALDLKDWDIDINVIHLLLKRPTRSPQKVQVKLEALAPGKETKAQMSTEISTEPDGPKSRLCQVGSDATHKESKQRFSMAHWNQDEGWQSEQWILHKTSAVDLLDYSLRVTVLNTSSGNQQDWTSIGYWEEGFSEIIEAMESSSQKLWFEAELKSKTGLPTGLLRMEVDVHTGVPHRSQRDALRKKQREAVQAAKTQGLTQPPQWVPPVVPIRSGMKEFRDGNSLVTHFVALYADSLPSVRLTCAPFVRLIMGTGPNGRAESIHKHASINDVEFGETVKIQAKQSDRKVRIELWDDNSVSDELIGEVVIYDMVPNRVQWLHFFGGALGEPVKKDEAFQMTRGAIRPASTYRGSLALNFGGRAKIPANFFSSVKTAGRKVSLIMRLYRGIYLDAFVGKAVHVLVQLPGSRLQVEPPKDDEDEKNVADKHFNHSILSFPGKVDEYGVLRFTANSGTDKAHSDEPKVAWVERATPIKEPVRLLPGIAHVYLYIVPVGDEERPPQVFGKMRFIPEYEPDAKPRWKRMRYDASVVDYPPSQYKDDLAGFILGTAVICEHMPSADDETSPKEEFQNTLNDRMGKHNLESEITWVSDGKNPEKRVDVPKASKPASVLCRPCAGETYVNIGSPGETVRFRNEMAELKRTVYCHIDVLAARSLQAMDDNGLSDPCYGIRIEDKLILNSESVRSLDPTYMDRIIVPIEVECELDDDGLLPEEPSMPLPPVKFILLDKDQNAVLENLDNQIKRLPIGASALQLLSKALGVNLADLGAKLVQMGIVVTKRPQILDAKRRGPSDELDLNAMHQASWRALDMPGVTPYDGRVGGVDPSWRKRPRVLLAVGYSLHMNIKNVTASLLDEEDSPYKVGANYRLPIETEEYARYQITVDLLGLRKLSSNIQFPELLVSSFWKGLPASVDVEPIANPNFVADKAEDDEKDEFVKALKPILPIKGEGIKKGAASDGWGFSMSFADEGEEKEDDSESEESSGGHEVEIEEILGTRMKAPEYKVAIVPYLQTVPGGNNSRQEHAGGVGDLVATENAEAKQNKPKDPYVLMPDLVFRLTNSFTFSDYGTLSVTLPLYGGNVDDEKPNWATLALQEYSAMPVEDRGVKQLTNVAVLEDAYEVFVDCFAATPGWLRWNDNTRMGRALRHRELFYITPERPDEVEERIDEENLSPEDEVERRRELNPPFSQFFNAADWIIGDSKNEAESFDHRVTPALRCSTYDAAKREWTNIRKDPAHVVPLGPQELLSDLPGFEYKKARTGDLFQKGHDAGYRAVSHLCVPEAVGEPKVEQKSLEKNLHTFIVEVGHEIREGCRDSKYLARLRMTIPDMFDELIRSNPAENTKEYKLKKQVEDWEAHTNNFVTIKFKYPGIVVWVAPPDKFIFDRPGEALFAVRLSDGTDVVVPVGTPVFDLRFQRETVWLVKKTLVQRWRDLERRIKKRSDAANKSRARPTDSGVDQPTPPDGGAEPAQPTPDGTQPTPDGTNPANDAKKKKEAAAAKAKEEMGPDGYSQPIPVKKNAFVCRITKRAGSHNFDRVRTKNWFRCVLEDVFQEVRDLPIDDIDDIENVRSYFFSRFMNLCQNLVSGEAHEEAGKLKGHAIIRKITAKDDEKRAQKKDEEMGDEPTFGIRPIQNLWIREEVNVNIYILTARNLKTDRFLGGASSFRPYLTCEIMGTSEIQTSSPLDLDEDATAIDYYQHFAITLVVPGASTLRLSLYNKSLLGATLIGEVEVDLEDRHFLLDQAKLHANCSHAMLLARRSPDKVTLVKRIEEGAKGSSAVWDAPTRVKMLTDKNEPHHTIKPHLSPNRNLPIEATTIWAEDEETGTKEKMGTLRFWCDITPAAEFVVPATLHNSSVEFEVHIDIWDITGIAIFRDMGERNDVYVKGKLKACGPNGKEIVVTEKTDVHKWATTTATFNWRFVYTVLAPTSYCTVDFTMLDMDTVSDDDPIYDSKSLNLDHHLMLAFTNADNGRPPLGIDSTKIVFDAWPKSAKKAESDVPTGCCTRCCGCCRRRGAVHSPSPAIMHIDVKVVPKGEADGALPGQIREPKDRMSWQSAAKDPLKFFKVVVGRKNYRTGIKVLIVTLLTALLLTFLVLSYLLLNTYLLPILR